MLNIKDVLGYNLEILERIINGMFGRVMWFLYGLYEGYEYLELKMYLVNLL